MAQNFLFHTFSISPYATCISEQQLQEEPRNLVNATEKEKDGQSIPLSVFKKQ